MKKLAISLALILGANASKADVVPVASRAIEMGGGATWLMFGYDDTGAAWIEEKDMNGYTSGDWTTYPRFSLAGLRFDPARRQILFGRVACANVVPMAAGESVVNTGRCRLRATIRDMGPDGPRLESISMEVR